MFVGHDGPSLRGCLDYYGIKGKEEQEEAKRRVLCREKDLKYLNIVVEFIYFYMRTRGRIEVCVGCGGDDDIGMNIQGYKPCEISVAGL